MPAEYVTKQVAKLMEHLGTANKRPETIALEDKALALPPASRPRPAATKRPRPKGGLAWDDIGKTCGRSATWAYKAVPSAERREQARLNRDIDIFAGSVVALRKFTSTELLDAGFNTSMVAKRQGHHPQVLVKHYSKARKSADRKAAEFLGRVVHGQS